MKWLKCFSPYSVAPFSHPTGCWPSESHNTTSESKTAVAREYEGDLFLGSFQLSFLVTVFLPDIRKQIVEAGQALKNSCLEEVMCASCAIYPLVAIFQITYGIW